MNVKKILFFLWGILCVLSVHVSVIKAEPVAMKGKVRIKAVGIPLADHYAGIVAYEKYRHKMEHADFQLLLLPGPDFVRAYFRSEPDADIAFNVCPMVMDMFAEKADFKWISLIHRDGNTLVINSEINKHLSLSPDKQNLKPDDKLAAAISELKEHFHKPVECAVPSPLATHTTVLYKYLKDHHLQMDFLKRENVDVILNIVKPPESPVFLKKKASRMEPALFEQSLPWGELAEIGGYGRIAWYSKDVMHHAKGHVECVIIARDSAVREKYEAVKEVVYYIHKAGQDIEAARRIGGMDLDRIIAMIQKHIPEHSRLSIIQSLRPDLMVINYNNLNIDGNSKESLRQIMDLAVEAGLLKKAIDIEKLADERFSTDITVK